MIRVRIPALSLLAREGALDALDHARRPILEGVGDRDETAGLRGATTLGNLLSAFLCHP